MFREEVRLRRARRARRRRALGAAVTGGMFAAALLVLVGFRPHDAAPRTSHPRVHHVHHVPAPPVVPLRPPQFVVVSFDGAGGDRLWKYWLPVARRADAHFTFFVSGVYLLDEARRTLYHPPRHAPGESDIWFARPDGHRSAAELIRGTLQEITAAYDAGHEIGTHFNGHFCAPFPGNVGVWDAGDWKHELDQFDHLLFNANANNHLRRPVRLPFGASEIVGERTPCLQGRLRVLYPVLAHRGFRYDASQTGPLGAWPRRELGLWSVPLLEIPFVHHTYRVVSMDYNFFANQTGSAETPHAIEEETFLSLRRAFRAEYFGLRAPLSIGVHFETWNDWAYDHAVTRLLYRVCRLREIRCVSFRELVDWLDAQPRRRLLRYRLGRFPRLRSLNPG